MRSSKAGGEASAMSWWPCASAAAWARPGSSRSCERHVFRFRIDLARLAGPGSRADRTGVVLRPGLRPRERAHDPPLVRGLRLPAELGRHAGRACDDAPALDLRGADESPAAEFRDDGR